MNKKNDKEIFAELLAHKTQETHASVMKKLGITPEEDRAWHAENGATPGDFFKTQKN